MRSKRHSIAGRGALLFGALLAASSPAFSDPVIDQPGYRIDLVITGVGASDGMTLSPSGDLFLTDYAGGRILKVADPSQAGPPKSPTVVASGIPFPTDVAFNAN